MGKVYWALKSIEVKSGKWGSPKGDSGCQPSMACVCAHKVKMQEGKGTFESTDSGLPKARTPQIPKQTAAGGQGFLDSFKGSWQGATSKKFGLES